MMGSAELSNPAKVSSTKHYLGSVASAVSKTCSSHVVIVKSFPTTIGGNAPA